MSGNSIEAVRHFDSPCFGSIRDATEDEMKVIEALAESCPAAIFAAINRRLNQRGLLIAVDALDGRTVPMSGRSTSLPAA